MKPYRASKAMVARATNGRFRKWAGKDFGIGGVCPNCRHLLLNYYDGDESASVLDPAKFRYRCFNCEPITKEELP